MKRRTFILVDPWVAHCPVDVCPRICVDEDYAEKPLFEVVEDFVRPLVFEGQVAFSDVAFEPAFLGEALSLAVSPTRMDSTMTWTRFVGNLRPADTCLLLWRPAQRSGADANKQNLLLRYAREKLGGLPPFVAESRDVPTAGLRMLQLAAAPKFQFCFVNTEHVEPRTRALKQIRGSVLVENVDL